MSRKLRAKGYDSELVEPLLDQLSQEGLQSDARYADSYLYSRLQKGYGPVRLNQELKERGVDDVTIENSLENLEIDWTERLTEVRKKNLVRRYQRIIRSRRRNPVFAISRIYF